MNLATWYVQNGYRMNRELREGRPLSDKEAKRLIAQIKSSTPLASEMILYRGLDWQQEVLPIDRAVMSVTDDEDIANSFIKCRIVDGRAVPNGTMLILNVQPGVRVLRIGGVQSEYLIEPGIKLTETNRTTVTKHGGQITYVWCDASKDNVSSAAATLGRKGGQSTSKAKQKAARRNGELGGRPRK